MQNMCIRHLHMYNVHVCNLHTMYLSFPNASVLYIHIFSMYVVCISDMTFRLYCDWCIYSVHAI